MIYQATYIAHCFHACGETEIDVSRDSRQFFWLSWCGIVASPKANVMFSVLNIHNILAVRHCRMCRYQLMVLFCEIVLLAFQEILQLS